MAISAPVCCALLTLLYAVCWQAHVLGYSPTSQPLLLPWSQPKRPLLLHQVLVPQLLFFLACWIPVADRRFLAAALLPLFTAAFWQLLASGSSSPAVGYGFGTFVATVAFKALEVLVFRPVDDMRMVGTSGEQTDAVRTGEKKDEDEGDCIPYPRNGWSRAAWVLDLMHNLRGVGWNWCAPLPEPPSIGTTRGRWLLMRVLRGLAMYAWIDFLVFYIHILDSAFFLPGGQATGFFPAPAGKPYHRVFAQSVHTTWGYPPPVGFPPMPSDRWARVGYECVLRTMRVVLSASAMFSSISGMYTFVALCLVSAGTVATAVGGAPLRGWKRRWLAPEAWPDAFGHWSSGDFGGGVKGWWGRGWHGMFRSLFTAPAHWAISSLQLDRRGAAAKALGLTIPFGMSAILHFCGCWTQAFAGWGAVQFFLVQPLGILFESAVMAAYVRFVRPVEPRGQPGGGGRAWWWPWLEMAEKVAMYLWAVAWFVVTSEGLLEEYRWGGFWSVEPLPFSLWRRLMGERGGVWDTALGGRPWWRWASGPAEGGVLGDFAIVIV